LKLIGEATPAGILCESRDHPVTAQTLLNAKECSVVFVGKIRVL